MQLISKESPKANILVVDDMPDNLRLLMTVFVQQGYDVRLANNGEMALQAVHSIVPDLILLDIMMPGIDGYQVCQQLKADARTREIPVIFLSAMQEVTDKVQGFSVGGVDYITKPFQIQEVLARVNTHLTLKHLQQELQQEITRRKQAEEELRALNHQLQEANAAKDAFFAIIAHDLRGPFTGLIGLTGVIIEDLDRYTQEKIKRLVTKLHTSSKQVYALLTNLLTWSRIQRGHVTCEPQLIPLVGLITKNRSLFASQLQHKHLEFKNLVPPDITVYADYEMVDTVLRNLISNAVKFTDSGGTIEISTQHHEELTEIAITDTGIGISQDNLAKLFRIDAKMSRSGTAGEEGTGLGLILCKDLVEKNGGTIRVESEVGKGTTFRVTVPTSSEK